LPARAQDSAHTYLGIGGSYEYGSPTVMNRGLGGVKTFESDGTGVSWDNSFSGHIVLQMPQLFSEKFGFSFSAGFTKGSGEFKSNYYKPDLLADTVMSFRVFTSDVKIDIEPVITLSLSSKFYVSSGLWANYRISEDITEQRFVIEPANAVLENKLSHDTAAFGSALSTSKFHYGIPLKFGGRFPISDAISINPEIYSRIDLGETLRGFAASAISAGLSVGVVYDFNHPIAREIEAPKPPPVPVIFHASVGFHVNGISVHETSPRAVDTLIRRFLALPLAFHITEENSISATFHLLSKNEAEIFDYTSLDRISPQKCFSELLNVIGKRMREYPPEKILITGTGQSFKVQEYLHEVWGIAKERVAVTVIKSDTLRIGGSKKICSPLINEWTEERYLLPEVTIDKLISSNNGVRSWDLSLTEGKKILAHYTNADSQPTEEAALADPNIDNSDHTLVLKLIASDSLGNVREATDTLHVIPLSELKAHSHIQMENYSILSDSLNDPASWSSLLLERAAKTVTAENIISIRGNKKNAAQITGTKLLELLGKNNTAAKTISVESAIPQNADPNVPALVEVLITSKQK
ncbi:MAG: hypothetical protein ABI778_10475, partial [Ignavibacteriota bacterium]